MGAPKGAPVSPPSTISSTALMYDESSEARKSTALATSSGSPQRASGTVEEKKSETFAGSSAVALARAPRFQMGVFVAPGPVGKFRAGANIEKAVAADETVLGRYIH